MGPFGLAASSLGLASEIKKEKHLCNFHTYSTLIRKPCGMSHVQCYVYINI